MMHELRPAHAFSGTLISASELVELAEFATPSHFVSERHREEAATSLGEWCDFERSVSRRALQLAHRARHRAEVVELLRTLDCMLARADEQDGQVMHLAHSA